jgi:flagellar biosynthesis/type III secretory pathway M-ring protein FliF/YscJ
MWATVPSDAWFWLGIALGVLAMLLVVLMIYYISSNLLYRRRRKNADTAKERKQRASTEDAREAEVESPPAPAEPAAVAPEVGAATSARRLATSSAPLRAYAALQ